MHVWNTLKCNNSYIFLFIEDSVIFLAIPRRVTISIWNFKFHQSATSNFLIKFEEVKINVGGGYDQTTGVFTCPSEGYYVFHWSVTSANHEQPCSSAILKNGIEIIWNEIGGNLGAFHLNKNDRTWIKAKSNCSIVSDHSSFSGFKII